jgi:hypothetical protein
MSVQQGQIRHGGIAGVGDTDKGHMQCIEFDRTGQIGSEGARDRVR